MARFSIFKLLFLGGLAAFILSVSLGAVCTIQALAEQPAQIKTIPVKEIKKEEGEGAGKISLEQVEKARQVTTERMYWLAGLWALILVAIVLMRWQLKDDEKLYTEGYYSKEL